MSTITLQQWQARLAAYLDAEVQALKGQSYEIDSGNGARKLTRADLGEIRDGIKECNLMIARLTPSPRGRTRYLVSE